MQRTEPLIAAFSLCPIQQAANDSLNLLPLQYVAATHHRMLRLPLLVGKSRRAVERDDAP